MSQKEHIISQEELDEEENFIVDCDVLEAAKENIQPIAGGRRVTSLASVLATPHAQREARLSSTRARIRAEVDAALAGESEEEPLEAYVRFVKWTIEHYPQGHSAESGILELLEEATRALKDDKNCRGDIRYLKLWITFARYVDRPEIIFEFLLVNDIGTSHAMFYEEYGLVLERNARRQRADEIYLLGINRYAEPLDHLKNRHRDFQMRMMLADSPAEPVDSGTPDATIQRRTALGSVTGSSSKPSRRPALSSSTGSISSSISSVPSGSHLPTRPNAKMAIFVDPTGEVAEVAEASAWPELGGRKTRVKENTVPATKMSETTLKQTGASLAATNAAAALAKRKPKIVPYRDPEPEEQKGETSKNAVPAVKTSKPLGKASFTPFRDEEGESVISAKPRFVPFSDEAAIEKPLAMKPKARVESSEAEEIRKNPLKNYSEGERALVSQDV